MKISITADYYRRDRIFICNICIIFSQEPRDLEAISLTLPQVEFAELKETADDRANIGVPIVGQ